MGVKVEVKMIKEVQWTYVEKWTIHLWATIHLSTLTPYLTSMSEAN